MQAAILLRNKRKTRKKKKNTNGKFDPPPRHVATREIPPFPSHPPFRAWTAETQQKTQKAAVEQKRKVRTLAARGQHSVALVVSGGSTGLTHVLLPG